jgi:serine/threonine-protein kinase RsbT
MGRGPEHETIQGSYPDEGIRVVAISRSVDTIFCSREATLLAGRVGIDTTGIWEVAISVRELVTNVLKFAGKGRLILKRLSEPRPGIEITVEDDGPGIDDIERAMVDGVSEGRDVAGIPVKERRGLGGGLGAVDRLMDEFELVNRPEGGVRATARKWVKAG